MPKRKLPNTINTEINPIEIEESISPTQQNDNSLLFGNLPESLTPINFSDFTSLNNRNETPSTDSNKILNQFEKKNDGILLFKPHDDQDGNRLYQYLKEETASRTIKFMNPTDPFIEQLKRGILHENFKPKKEHTILFQRIRRNAICTLYKHFAEINQKLSIKIKFKGINGNHITSENEANEVINEKFLNLTCFGGEHISDGKFNNFLEEVIKKYQKRKRISSRTDWIEKNMVEQSQSSSENPVTDPGITHTELNITNKNLNNNNEITALNEKNNSLIQLLPQNLNDMEIENLELKYKIQILKDESQFLQKENQLLKNKIFDNDSLMKLDFNTKDNEIAWLREDNARLTQLLRQSLDDLLRENEALKTANQSLGRENSALKTATQSLKNEYSILLGNNSFLGTEVNNLLNSINDLNNGILELKTQNDISKKSNFDLVQLIAQKDQQIHQLLLANKELSELNQAQGNISQQNASHPGAPDKRSSQTFFPQSNSPLSKFPLTLNRQSENKQDDSIARRKN